MAILDIVKALVTTIAPIFLITSPVTSYADQIYSIHRTRSSAGFSLDIPLIMLVASILKVYYWFGARFDLSLLVQAVIMISVQLLLLQVALANRPPTGPAVTLHNPFAESKEGQLFVERPFGFWQWKPTRPYWTFLLYFTISLAALQVIVGTEPTYVSLLGYTALAIEATLPLPQMWSNQKNKSCKGFRVSVLANWLLGDVMKMFFFFLADSNITWAFKLCGLFQFACDIYLGIQYLQFGDGQPEMRSWKPGMEDVRLS